VRLCRAYAADLASIVDSNGQTLAYVCGLDNPRNAAIAKALTRDEARRIASNIAKLPNLLGKGGQLNWGLRLVT
jgi:hypothetical protein